MEEITRGIFYSPGSMLMLEEVVLPDSVKKIGYRAFCDCGYLKEITLPKNLEFIDADAFWNCTDLKLSRSELPASLKVINGSAFYFRMDWNFLEEVPLEAVQALPRSMCRQVLILLTGRPDLL